MAVDYHLSHHTRACAVIPGGVNSPVRAFSAVGGAPIYIKSAQGAYLMDVDNRQFIDYVGGFGPAILGHAHPEVVDACQKAVARGMSFGACHEQEIAIAEKITTLMPNLEMVRLVNSGTEAAMTAVRLARAATGRPKIIKFTGGYHGHVDALLVSAGSGATTLGTPSSPGIPDQTTQDTLSCPYNDSDALARTLEANSGQIAGVMLEPICGNMGLVLPEPAFLSTLTTLCKKHGTLVIFDEVMTGFRVALGGAQSLYNCTPDLTVLGKIIGGGMPVGAIGGKQSLLSLLAPTGPVYQAGTLSGNPVTCAAGLATLDILARARDRIYPHLNDYTARLTQGLSACAVRHGVALQTSSIGGMFGFFFTPSPVTNYSQACSANTEQFTLFFHHMIAQGIYFAPSAFEAGFASFCHGDYELAHTLEAAEQAFSCMVR